MPIEMRWAVSPDTTTEKPVLQWRETIRQGTFVIRDWTDVPVVVVDPAHPSAPEGGKEKRDES